MYLDKLKGSTLKTLFLHKYFQQTNRLKALKDNLYFMQVNEGENIWILDVLKFTYFHFFLSSTAPHCLHDLLYHYLSSNCNVGESQVLPALFYSLFYKQFRFFFSRRRDCWPRYFVSSEFQCFPLTLVQFFSLLKGGFTYTKTVK